MRSAYGSRVAVEIAEDCLRTLAESCLASEEVLVQWSAPRTARQMVKQLTDTIVSRWYLKIRQHLEEEPLTEEELRGAGRYEEAYRSGTHLEHVYGTTLIAALQLPEYLLLIQQGDGRCDVFYTDGSVDQPIPWDDRCYENVTTSMCDEDVAASIRHCIIPLKKHPVIACFIGSDGVEDSYSDMEGTHTFYRKVCGELVRRGTEDFETYLDEMLPEFSTAGSGDDVSVAGIVNTEAVEPFLPLFQRLAQCYELSETKRYYEEKITSMTRKHSVLKKRAEDAREKWEYREESELLGAVGQDQELLELYESAQREFRAYDEKYQDLKSKLSELNASVDTLMSDRAEQME